ncbi:MAG: hypothetical protein RL380_548 [Verrucomicrobiota bacterium]
MPIAFAVVAVAVFVWLMIPSAKDKSVLSKSPNEPFIDPDDSYQIGLLVGMRGGTIPDAALMRFALQRFEEENGRRATSSDLGIVLGMIESSKRQ